MHAPKTHTHIRTTWTETGCKRCWWAFHLSSLDVDKRSCSAMCHHSCDANYAATMNKCHFKVMMEIMVTSVDTAHMLHGCRFVLCQKISKRCMSEQVLGISKNRFPKWALPKWWPGVQFHWEALNHFSLLSIFQPYNNHMAFKDLRNRIDPCVFNSHSSASLTIDAAALDQSLLFPNTF